jgi:hypothetical protein
LLNAILTENTATIQVAAEVHQRLTEEEKEPPQLDSKEKSPQSGANKKAKKEKEAPKKKKTDKKGKGIHGTRTWSTGHFKPLLGRKISY